MADAARSAANSGTTFLAGGGEMARLIRRKDWSQTPLGPIENWPQSLRTTVSLCLASNFPINIIWGPEHTQIYNDGYRDCCGDVHPRALGEDYRVTWASAWPVIGQSFERAFAGETMYLENQRMFLPRLNGALEETFFTFSHSPIRDESGGVGGLFHPVTETTATMLSARRTRALRDLSAGLGTAIDEVEVAQRTVEILSRFELDLPFLFYYARDPEDRSYCLASHYGVGCGGSNAPSRLAFDTARLWPIAEAVAAGRIVEIGDLTGILRTERCGPYAEPPSRALVIPIVDPAAELPPAVIVTAASSRLRFNADYRSFYELLRVTITAALATVRAREEERRRAEALAEIDRAKIRFFSNVSHEFRTPLTLMLGPLEDLLAAPSESLPQRREELALVHRNSLRLLRLVNTLLDFSRIEAGRVQASYEAVDLPSLTADLASAFRAAIERAGLQLTVDCPPLIEPVWVDRDMWEKIVLNLVSNAFKFTFVGEIAVRVRKEGGFAVLQVQDTGTGIPAEEIPRLFDRFHRIEGARGRTHEGTGIGLALVQELTKLHGGMVEVESVYREGSTFSVTLPLGSAHLPQDRLRAAPALASTAIGARPFIAEALRWLPDDHDDVAAETAIVPAMLREPATVPDDYKQCRATILFADDNADMRDYVRRLLGGRYEVHTVADGVAALAEIEARRPNLLLSDVMMPGLDGYGLVRRVRADAALAGLPIILLSARAGEDDRIEGRDDGADDYLVKPFSARELLARVRASLELARLRRRAEQQMAADLDATRRLCDISDRCIRGGNGFDECLQGLVDTAIAITGADKGTIQLLDPASGMLEIAAQRGFEAAFLEFFAHVQAGEAATCGKALQTRERVIVEDVTQSEVFADGAALEVLLEADVRAVQSTRLKSSAGTLCGMISTHFSRPHRPSEHELRYMDLLARQAADYLERIRADGATQALAAELKQILDTSATGLTHCSRELRYVSANPAYANIAGLPLDQIIGRSIAEVMGEAAFATIRPYVDRALQGERVEYEAELPWAARGARWNHFVCTPCREGDGTISGWVASVRDVTLRKRTEANLLGQKRILEMVATGASLTDTLDALMLFIEAREPGARCTLLLVDDDGKHFRGGSGPSLPDSYLRAVDGAPVIPPYLGACSEAADLCTGVSVPDLASETRYAPEWRALMLSYGLRAARSTPVIGSSGLALASLAVYYDKLRDPLPADPDLIEIATQLAVIAIERDRAEQSLRNLNETLERQVAERSRALETEMAERQKVEEMLQQSQRLEAIGRLTGGVAHDFNNLLTVIVGQAESIIAAAGNERVAHMARAAQRAAERGSQLTGQLLSFSRRQQLQPVTASVRQLILDFAELVRRAVGETVAVDIAADPGLWAAHLDPAQFEAAMLNLAVNARDAMPNGGRLDIRARNVTLVGAEAARLDVASGDYVVVSVADTGHGMAPEVRRRAFEPFFSTKDVGQGTGLGLAQIYGFAKQSGGTVTLDSAVGAGTTVALYLPKAAGAMDGEARGAEPDRLMRGHGRTILVVEDQPEVLEVIEAFLEGLDFRVLTASDGPAALVFLASNEPIDLLLTDVVMPNGVSGLELARDARRLRQDLKIVVVSGYLRDADSRDCDLSGLVFLEKPFRRTQLVETIAAALDDSGR